MTTILALVATALLAQSPQDPFGPLLFREEALLIRARLLAPDKPKTAPSSDALKLLACERLFEECRAATDEFAKRRALDAHRDELEQLAAPLLNAPTVVLAGTMCFGDYDFKARRLPVKTLTVYAPSRDSTFVQDAYDSPVEFKLSRAWTSVQADAPTAERLVTQYPGLRCAELRIEVALPTKPARWTVKTTGYGWSDADFLRVAVPVVVKRARLIAVDGSTLTAL